MTNFLTKLSSLLCGIRGHDGYLQFDHMNERMSLWCPSCGWHSEGWDLQAKQFKFMKVEAKK